MENCWNVKCRYRGEPSFTEFSFRFSFSKETPHPQRKKKPNPTQPNPTQPNPTKPAKRIRPRPNRPKPAEGSRSKRSTFSLGHDRPVWTDETKHARTQNEKKTKTKKKKPNTNSNRPNHFRNPPIGRRRLLWKYLGFFFLLIFFWRSVWKEELSLIDVENVTAGADRVDLNRLQ